MILCGSQFTSTVKEAHQGRFGPLGNWKNPDESVPQDAVWAVYN